MVEKQLLQEGKLFSGENKEFGTKLRNSIWKEFQCWLSTGRVFNKKLYVSVEVLNYSEDLQKKLVDFANKKFDIDVVCTEIKSNI